MKRREFLRSAAAGVAGGLGLALGACANAPVAQDNGSEPQAQAPAQGSSMPAVEWRCGTSWPTSLDTIYGGAVTVAERVAALTDGMFRITPSAAGELFPGLEVLQNVQSGTVECGHTAAYYYVGLNSAFGIATSLPFGLTAQQQNAWLYHGGGIDALRPVFAKFDTIHFPAGNTGAQMGGWFRNEISTVADIQGLRVRIPGLGGQVMQRLGAVTQTLPGGEIFQALQTGAIDAAEWVGAYDDQKLGLNGVAPFYYTPGWWEPGPTLDLVVSLSAYEALPNLYKEILSTAAYEANLNMLSKYDALNRIAITEFIDSGTQVTSFTDEIMTAAQTAAFELYEENVASNPDFATIFGPWREFRSQIYRWTDTNEIPFHRFVLANSVS